MSSGFKLEIEEEPAGHQQSGVCVRTKAVLLGFV
jgi:hypothetical protein